MRIWRQDFRILSSDVDLTRKIRLSILFTKLQEAAIAHTIELGVTREKTLDRGLLWAVTQYRLKTDRMPEYDDQVTLRIHLVVRTGRLHSFSAEIHEGLGLHQKNLLSFDHSRSDPGFELILGHIDPVAVRQDIQCLKTAVMPGLLIFATGIAQPCDNKHLSRFIRLRAGILLFSPL